jgi:hypothetical protein
MDDLVHGSLEIWDVFRETWQRMYCLFMGPIDGLGC